MFGLERKRMNNLLEKPGIGKLHLDVLEQVIESHAKNQVHIPLSLERLFKDRPDFLKLVEKYKRAAKDRTEAIVMHDRQQYKAETGKEWDWETIQSIRENIGQQEAGLMAVEEELLKPLVNTKLVKVVGTDKIIRLPLLVSSQKLANEINEARKKLKE